MAQLSQVPQIGNGKPDFSPMFQKVKLCNSTFFQPSQRFSASHHLSDFLCLTISVMFHVSPMKAAIADSKKVVNGRVSLLKYVVLVEKY